MHWPRQPRRQLPGVIDGRAIAAIRLTHRPQSRFALLAGPGVAVHRRLNLLLPLSAIVVFSFWRTESYELIADWNLDNYRTAVHRARLPTFFLRSLDRAPCCVSLVCLVYRLAGRLLHREIRRPLPPAAGAAAGGAVLHRRDPAHHRRCRACSGPVGLINMALASSACRPIGRSCTRSSPPASGTSISSSRSW